jgi:hypothetical protein
MAIWEKRKWRHGAYPNSNGGSEMQRDKRRRRDTERQAAVARCRETSGGVMKKTEALCRNS